jgi:hypothetical protein
VPVLADAIERASAALPAPEDAPSAKLFCADALTEALRILEQRGVRPAPSVAQSAGPWCITTIQSLDVGTLHADRSPVGQGHFATSGGSRLLDASLRFATTLFPTLDQAARDAFWAALEAVMGTGPAPLIVRSLATSVGSLLGTTDAGWRLYRRISREVLDGDALAWTLPIVGERPDCEQAEIFNDWIHRQPPLEPVETMLSDALGQSMVGAGPAVAALRDRLLARGPSRGVLAAPSAYRRFIGGVAIRCTEAVDFGAAPADVARLVEAAWAALQRVPADPGERPVNFALIVFRAVDGKSAERAVAIWEALAPLARIVIEQGPLNEVSDLLFNIGDESAHASLGARALLPCADALVERLAASPSLGPDEADILPSRACGFLSRLGCDAGLSEAERERLLHALQSWAAPALAWPDAVPEALRVRQSLA